MKHPIQALSLAALALCAVSTAACQSNQPKAVKHDTLHEQIFHEIDDNSDGKIDHEEFTRYFYTVSFDFHDVDANDQLTLVEWVGPSPEGEHEVLFAEMDEDGSGWLIIREYSSHPLRTITVKNAFMTMDRNGDEYLELTEMHD